MKNLAQTIEKSKIDQTAIFWVVFYTHVSEAGDPENGPDKLDIHDELILAGKSFAEAYGMAIMDAMERTADMLGTGHLGEDPVVTPDNLTYSLTRAGYGKTAWLPAGYFINQMTGSMLIKAIEEQMAEMESAGDLPF